MVTTFPGTTPEKETVVVFQDTVSEEGSGNRPGSNESSDSTRPERARFRR